MNILKILILFIGISFLFYGFGCLVSNKMKDEFKRFQLSNFQRKLTGALQILGSLGLIFGYYFFEMIAFLAAIGLGILMLAGFGVRLKIKDKLIQSFPSLFFAILNLYVAYLLFEFI
ncbi:DoxX family protein [Psychroflexus aestuariivivens]|uniref:DoxX family protein n=1 Tax=Psychroflexus aestuariivivens TaxID=1795040 RepID=UPI000FD7E293|nr:DoxX family protein [Psychroflexus aestuariivivens]